MEQIIIDIGTLFRHLFSPEILSVVITLSGIGYKLFQSISKKMKADQDLLSESFQEEFSKVNARLATMEEVLDKRYQDNQKEILRLELLDGMHDKRLSPTEVEYFYEKYKAVGGNSFVTAQKDAYIKDHVYEEGEKYHDQKSD